MLPMYQYSEELATNVLDIISKLPDYQKRSSMIDQLRRSATSVFANMNEAKSSQSKRDYVHKLSIALKECRETEGWIKLLLRAEILSLTDYEIIRGHLRKVGGALYAVIKAMKKKL